LKTLIQEISDRSGIEDDGCNYATVDSGKVINEIMYDFQVEKRILSQPYKFPLVKDSQLLIGITQIDD